MRQLDEDQRDDREEEEIAAHAPTVSARRMLRNRPSGLKKRRLWPFPDGDQGGNERREAMYIGLGTVLLIILIIILLIWIF